jgi:hypothetical protein
VPRDQVRHPTVFEQLRDQHGLQGDKAYGPFADEDDWEAARFTLKHLRQNATNEFLKLQKVRLAYLLMPMLGMADP